MGGLIVVEEELRMKGRSWIIYPERGELVVLQRSVPRFNDLGLAEGKGVDSAVLFLDRYQPL